MHTATVDSEQGTSLSRECLLYLCLIRLQQNVHKPGSRASTLEPAGSADVALTGASAFPRLMHSSDQCRESLQCLHHIA